MRDFPFYDTAIYTVAVVAILIMTRWVLPAEKKLVREPVERSPKCVFCGGRLDCPTCGAANFAPRLEVEFDDYQAQ